MTPMTFAEFIKQGFLAEIGGLLNTDELARPILIGLGYPLDRIPSFDNALSFLDDGCQEYRGRHHPRYESEFSDPACRRLFPWKPLIRTS